jgi:hypothetical protein
MDRYYVDQRVGCIAVRDSMKNYGSPGLHTYTYDVVKYWYGRKDASGEWEVPWRFIKRAHRLSHRLNRKEPTP